MGLRGIVEVIISPRRVSKNLRRWKLTSHKIYLQKKKKRKRKKRFSHSHNTKRTEYRTELMYRAKEWIRIAAARV